VAEPGAGRRRRVAVVATPGAGLLRRTGLVAAPGAGLLRRTGLTAPGAGLLRRTGLVVAGAAVGTLVAFPLAELFATAFEEGGAAVVRAFAGAGTLRAVRNTLLTGAGATLLATVAGAAAALVTERTRAPGRRWLRAGMLLPLIVPPFVAALGWAQAYGPAGLTDDIFGGALPGVYGAAGVVAVIAVHAVPLVYVAVAAGLASRAEPDVERAARLSGASGWVAFRTVTLPLLRPALTAGAALAFVTAVNAFGVPAMLGTPAGFATVTTRIYSDLVLAADPAAFSRVVVLAAGLVVLTLAVVGAADVRDGLRGSVARTAAPAGGDVPEAGGRWPGALAWAYLAATTGVPLLALVLVSVTRAVGLPPVPANWTLAHFRTALDGLGGAALGRSLSLAIVAATVAVLLGGLLTVLRHRRGGRSLGTVATLTFAVPGSALAVAMLLAYGRWFRDTLLLIVLAYLAKFWALAHRPIAGAADGVPPDLPRAARISGATPPVALRTVTVPLLRPAVAGAWLVVFLFGIHELTMSSLLYGPGSETLAVVILNLQQLGDITVTTALAVLLTGLVLAVAGLLALVRGWSRRPPDRR